MQLVCTCRNCTKMFVDTADEVTVEMDFLKKEIRFVCTSCKHDNVMSMETEADIRARQPLPRTSVTRG